MVAGWFAAADPHGPPPRVLASAGAHLGGLADVLADVCPFSVSAVAVNLADGGVYDPPEGLCDLKAGRLRLIASPSTAAATAAFLLAAEFGLRVPPRLRGRLLSADRTDPAATRALLADIVALPDPMVPVRRAHRAGALEVSVPEVAALFLEDRQGRHKDILVHTLRTVPFPPGRSRGWWRIRIGRSVTTWPPTRLSLRFC